ncbi:hypothetical protein D5086_002573 [Populus alba]|uniref:Uncharacterized protein n=1 Tax=Populus alba TaxID=43335 RepID=A0ACC4D365_POPAL
MNMVHNMLLGKQIPKEIWSEVVNWAIHKLNQSPTSAVKEVTSEEAWSGNKPSVYYFRVFGCIAHVHIPEKRRSKLDDKNEKCIMLGVSEEAKAYRLYNLVSKKVIISSDVVFVENEKWEWEKSNEEIEVYVLEWGDEEEIMTQESEEGMNVEIEEVDSVNAEIKEVDKGGFNSPSGDLNANTEGEGLLEEYEIEILVMFTTSEDPACFEDVVKSLKWRETKLNEKGEVDKFKARLVAKGYSQQHGINYSEVFAPVARWDTIKVVLAFATQKGWYVYQLDVKNVFLHGELNEDVFVDQPQGFTKKGEEHKVYKLRRALYGLKQAPQAWYSKIEGYFIKEGFEKCYCEHTLFVKTEDGGKILIVSLYVDDLIFTGNNEDMFERFKKSMKKEFTMSDLGKMKYFLSVEVIKDHHGIFINPKKYAHKVLERFGMLNSNLVKNPIIPSSRLSKNEGGAIVDTTMFKQMLGSLMYLTASKLDFIGGEEELVGFADSDYAGDIDDKKITFGYTFMLGTGAVSWSSKKQPVVTLSTTKVEFIVAAYCAC